MAWEFGPYQVDEDLFELRRAGTRVDLRPMSLRFLLYLAEHSSRAVPSEELQTLLWPGLTVASSSFRQLVRSARRSLGADGAKRIVTVRGFGYRLTGPVRRIPSARKSEGRTSDPPGAARGSTPRLARGSFTGRTKELRKLLRAAEEARNGKGRIVMLTGQPGVGKYGLPRS